jgi:YVTN family beta-propeller protein
MKGISKHLVTALSFAALHTSLLLSLPAPAASAQVGGPKDMTPRAASEKAAPSKPPRSVSGQVEHEGIKVDFTLKSLPGEKGEDAGLVAGANAEATFRMTYAHTGQPVTGMRPKAWVSSRVSEQLTEEAACKDKIRTFMGGLLSTRAEVDLSSYLLLTLNHDNTISVINPQVSFSKTQLESLITLPGPGADWMLSKNKNFLYVTLPEQSAVAVIDTATKKLVGNVPVGEKTRPVRVALQPDGQHVWVGLDGSPSVAVIDTTTNKLSATLAAGAGLHQIEFTPDGRIAYVTNSEAGSVSAFDAVTLSKIGDIKVGRTPVPLAASSASRLVYVAAINGTSVSAIDPARQEIVASIPVKRGVVALKFEPRGRFGFAVNQSEGTVSVIDSSTNAVVGSTTVVREPDQITFTDRFAYVRGIGSEKFSLIELKDFSKAKISAVDIQAGQQPASSVPAELGVADMIAPTPEGNSAMIANTPDQMIYYYVEGMMAPMGTIKNYKRRPRALLVLDRSLSEVAPGVYSAPLTLKTAGRFDVPLLIDQPRIFKCFPMEVAESPDGVKARPGATSLSVEPAFRGRQFKPGDAVTLKFKITDSVTGQPVKGLKDVQVLMFEPPGLWQQRQWARESEDGVYEVTQVFPGVALYHVMVGVASRGVSYADLPLTAVPVIKDAPPAPATKASVNGQGQLQK